MTEVILWLRATCTMTPTKKTTHIFIVESGKLYVNMLDYIFKKDFTYRFINFKSGEECIQNLHLQPEIIVLDHELPGMNGYETLIEIKKHHPAAHVIVWISDADNRLPSELFEAGAGDYVMKENFGVSGISQKIERYLKNNATRGMSPPNDKPSPGQTASFILLLLLASAGFMYSQ